MRGPAGARPGRYGLRTVSDHDVAGNRAVVELVILDCDGVLVDSERLASRVGSRMITALGWPLSEAEVVERFLGRTESYVMAEIERVLGRPVPGWVEDHRRALQEAFHRDLRPVPGVEAALDELALGPPSSGRPAPSTCVASSGPHEKIRLTLGLTGLYPRFEGRIFSAVDVERGKPAPDLFLHVAARLGAQPGACVVVEDSPAGVEAARAAGMRCLAYAGSGLVPVSALQGAGTVVFTDMSDLPGLVRELSDGRAPGP